MMLEATLLLCYPTPSGVLYRLRGPRRGTRPFMDSSVARLSAGFAAVGPML